MENTNEMKLIFDSSPVNEGLARVTVAAFCTQLNPTLEEVADLKTAVSEAVTNCIIHAYEGKIRKIRDDLQAGRKSTLGGCGGSGSGNFRYPPGYGTAFYHKAGERPFRNGFYFYGGVYG